MTTTKEAIQQIAKRYGALPQTIASAMILFQANPVQEIGICHGLKDTGLKVGATPNKMIGVIECATGEVLYEWNGR
jgi:hypothetical protein